MSLIISCSFPISFFLEVLNSRYKLQVDHTFAGAAARFWKLPPDIRTVLDEKHIGHPQVAVNELELIKYN